MPTNLYGPGDSYHPENSHVIPALIRRFHEATASNMPEVVARGTGTPMREFLYVDDMAEASVFLMNLDSDTYRANTEPMLSHINVGTGIDCTIKQLTDAVARRVGYRGKIVWDSTKSDGAPRKLMCTSLLKKLGWSNQISLETGLMFAYHGCLKRLQTDEIKYKNASKY